MLGAITIAKLSTSIRVLRMLSGVANTWIRETERINETMIESEESKIDDIVR